MNGIRLLNRITFALPAAGVACAFSVAAMASETTHIDQARVVSVDPLVRTVTVNTPRQECWDEVVQVPQPSPGKTYTPEILGSIIGAAVGNQFGRARASSNVREVVEQRCRTVNEQHVEERIEGYDVTYRWHGREYTTRMPYDPGDRMRVRVSVAPVD